MDIRKVKKLIELLDESGIAEIEITEGEDAVRISRYPQGGHVVHAAPMPAVAPAPAAAAAAAASSPGAAPYGQVGDRVNEGDTLCILEAMKMMNQIEAEVSGTIKSIRVQNGDAVEYGQTLFVIDQRGDS